MTINLDIVLIIAVAVGATAYLIKGLYLIKDDKSLCRELNRTTYTAPIFGLVMAVPVVLFWPAKSVWGALIWTVNEYMEKPE